MKLYLFKPFGADNYLALTEMDELQELFDKLVPGDEMIIRVLEFSEDEYNQLGTFDGFGGPSGLGETEEEEVPPEEMEEVPPEEMEEVPPEEMEEDEEEIISEESQKINLRRVIEKILS